MSSYLEAPEPSPEPSPRPEPRNIPLACLLPYRPLADRDAMAVDGLAYSFSQIGQQSPLTVVGLPGDRWRVINGVRRLEAARRLGWHTMLAVDNSARLADLQSRAIAGEQLAPMETEELIRFVR